MQSMFYVFLICWGQRSTVIDVQLYNHVNEALVVDQCYLPH